MKLKDYRLATRVRLARKKKKLSQQSLADMVGCHSSVISVIERQARGSGIGYSDALVRCIGTVLDDQWLQHYNTSVPKKNTYSTGVPIEQQDLWEVIVGARLRLNLTQREVAQRWGYTLCYYKFTEQGTRTPSRDALAALERVLGVQLVHRKPWSSEAILTIQKLEAMEARTIGQEIKLRRLRLGYSLEQAANLVGVDRKSFSFWETGRRSPLTRWRTLRKLAEVLYYPEIAPALGLGEKIAEHRKRFGMTCCELAKILEVSYSCLSKWEVGARLPNSENLRKVDDFLRCNVDPRQRRSGLKSGATV